MNKLLQTGALSKRKLRSVQSEITVAHSDYKDVLMRRALYKTNDPEVSKDLVQKTFLKTLEHLQKGGKVDLMLSFLNHVLNALIIDEYRKNKIVSLDVLLENGFEPASDEIEKQVNILDGKQIATLIPRLPKKYELVIRLRYLKSLSLKEIALLTGQSANTVAVQIHRGLTKLKRLYSRS